MIYVGYFLLVVSWLFILFGMISIFKLKNMYTRILTSATIDTVASFLVLFSAMFMFARFDFILRLALLILFLIITNPISSHVNIRSAYLSGVVVNEIKG
jgi:multicomponent Na+:H+ antiporter subunit G